MSKATTSDVDGMVTGQGIRGKLGDVGARLRPGGSKKAMAGIAAGGGAAAGLVALVIRRRRRKARAGGPLKAAAKLPTRIVRTTGWKKPAIGLGVLAVARRRSRRRRLGRSMGEHF